MLTPRWRRYLRFWKADIPADVDEELRFHLGERVEDLMRAGHSRDDAEATALAEFGEVDRVRETLTEIDSRVATNRGRREWLDLLRQDLRYAIRGLLAARGMSGLVVVTLALGIGANAALFSLVDRLFLRPPPGVRDPGSLTRLYARDSGYARAEFRVPVIEFHYPGVRAIEAALPSDVRLTSYAFRPIQVGRGESPDVAPTAFIAPGYFRVLGVGPPALGRYPRDEELDVDHVSRVAVISWKQWQHRFAGDTRVVDRSIELGRIVYRIIGVTPRDFNGVDLDATGFWLPLRDYQGEPARDWYRNRSGTALRILVRSEDTPPRRIAALATAAYAAGPARDRHTTILPGPLSEHRGPRPPTPEVRIASRLIGVVLLVILIAAANVGNLLLVRGLQRRREVAVRLALGISRGRLVGLFLLESVVLSVVAAGAAIVAVWWGGTALRRTLMPDVDWSGGPVDWRVAVFTLAVALVVGVGASLPAALRSGREGLAESLRVGHPGLSRRASRLRSGFLVVQVALSALLLVGAGAFLRSLHQVSSIDTGYDVDRLLLLTLRFEDRPRTAAPIATRLTALESVVAGAPGAASTALASFEPMRSYAIPVLFRRDGSEITLPRDEQPSNQFVSGTYFETTGIRLLRGRTFDTRDGADAPWVMVVNRSMARLLWGSRDPLGECLRLGEATTPCVTVVGIAEDAHRSALIEAPGVPMFFMPVSQGRGEFGAPRTMLIRARDGLRISTVAAEVLARVRPTLPAGVYATVTPLHQSLGRQMRQWVVGTTLFSAFGLLALLVATVGTYSTIAYAVTQRTRELGVRAALGARASSLVRLVMGDALALIVLGAAVGLVLALLTGRMIAPLLYETTPGDPVVLIPAVMILVAVGLLASALPAWRALRIDPVVAIRAE